MFVVADALALESLDRTLDVAIDCGLFHASDSDRDRYGLVCGRMTVAKIRRVDRRTLRASPTRHFGWVLAYPP
jgi:hypothetical protein